MVRKSRSVCGNRTCAGGTQMATAQVSTISMLPVAVINPRCMRERYGSQSVCVFVCYHANCYIPCFYVENTVSWVLCGVFQVCNVCFFFAENAMFKSSGAFADLCGLPCSLTSS